MERLRTVCDVDVWEQQLPPPYETLVERTKGCTGLLALLACKSEGLSARRFAEYLSLGQLPPADRSPTVERWAAPDDGSNSSAASQTLSTVISVRQR